MSRYIDAEKIIFSERVIMLGGTQGTSETRRIAYKESVDKIPSADVEPIVHAHWIPLYGRMYACNDKIGEIVQTGYKCSACGREEEDRWQICRCGARMDEEVK